MRYRIFLAFFSACLLLAGQSGFQVPETGLLRDGRNALRPVLGMEANFLLGKPLLDGVQSVAASENGALVKTVDHVLVLDRDHRVVSARPAPPGKALFALTPAGAPLAAYLPANGSLSLWRRGHWQRMDLPPELAGDRVLALGPAPRNQLAMVSVRDKTYWLTEISCRSGRVVLEKVLPDVSPPLLVAGAGDLLYTDEDGLVLRHGDGVEQPIRLEPPPTALEPMGTDWVHVSSPAGSFALKLGGKTRLEPRLYRLPEVVP